jgi:pseudouridine synthase
VSIRLNKLLATRGIGARRKCDEIIQGGEVRINGRIVTEPGTQVEPERDRVEVRGRPLPRPAELKYFAFHKPVGVISTLDDPEGRRSLRDYLPPGARMFPVGRLDADTSGLIVLTNDGELAHHLMHPRYGVDKRYRAHVDHVPPEHVLERLRRGIEFEPGVVSAPAQVFVRDRTVGDSVLEFALHEGKHRQVRRMCEAAGLQVQRLHRWAYGPLKLGHLERGMWRELSEEEVAELRAASARAVPREGPLTGRRSFDRPRPRPRAGSASRPASVSRALTSSRPASVSRAATNSRTASASRAVTNSRPSTVSRSAGSPRPAASRPGGARPARADRSSSGRVQRADTSRVGRAGPPRIERALAGRVERRPSPRPTRERPARGSGQGSRAEARPAFARGRSGGPGAGSESRERRPLRSGASPAGREARPAGRAGRSGGPNAPRSARPRSGPGPRGPVPSGRRRESGFGPRQGRRRTNP